MHAHPHDEKTESTETGSVAEISEPKIKLSVSVKPTESLISSRAGPPGSSTTCAASPARYMVSAIKTVEISVPPKAQAHTPPMFWNSFLRCISSMLKPASRMMGGSSIKKKKFTSNFVTCSSSTV